MSAADDGGAARARLVLAADPDGALHLLASSVRGDDRRGARRGIADLVTRAAGADGPRLSELLAPTVLPDAAALADLVAHLVPLPRPDGPAGGRVRVEVCVLGDADLPEELAGPARRRFLLERTAPPEGLRGRALLFANAAAPGGPFWSTVGEAPFGVVGLGAVLSAAGRLGAGARDREATGLAQEVARWRAAGAAFDDEALAAALSARLALGPGGAAGAEGSAPGGGLLARAVAAEDGLAFTVGAPDGPELSWFTARFEAAALAELDAARASRALPYWLLLFDRGADGAPVLARVVNARRRFARALDVAEVTA